MNTMLQENNVQAVEKLHKGYRLITEQLSRVIVGQQQVIEELLVAMFARDIACWWACRAWPT